MEKKLYEVTEHISVNKMVTKEEYVSRMKSKLNYYYEQMQDRKLKLQQAQRKLEEEHRKFMQISNQLDALVSEDEHKQAVEYAEWRYKEMYPKKMAKLKEEK